MVLVGVVGYRYYMGTGVMDEDVDETQIPDEAGPQP
jgi:hypothetical protein